MIKQRFLGLFFIVLSISVLLFAGCTVSQKEGKGKLVLNYWDTMPPMDKVGMAIRDLIKEYNSTHTNIFIKTTYIEWSKFNDKLMTAIVGGAPPDVVLLDRFVTASYAARKALVPLDELIKKDKIKSSDFFKACWDECVYNGKVWSIPHHTDIRALYYRVEDFQSVGLDPNKPPRTWKELEEYAKKLTIRDNNGTLERIGFIPQWGNTSMYMWGWLNGGKFMVGNKVTCNDPRIVEALNWVVKFNDWYGRRAVEGAAQSYGQRDMDPFITGQLSMKIDGDWYLGILKQYGPRVKFKVASPPAPKGKKSITWSGGFALAIPKGTKYQKEVWEFIKYMISYESQLKYAKAAYRIPALKKAAHDKFFTEDPYYKVFIKLMEVTKFRPVTPVANYYWSQLEKAMEYSILHRKSPKTALEDAAENTQKYLDEYLSGK